MISSNPEERDGLAGEYVLGTLAGHQRREFEIELRRDAALRALVEAWVARIGPLVEGAGAITPPARIWKAIERRISGRSVPARGTSWWHSLPLWRGLALAGTAAAAALALYVGMADPARLAPDYVAVLNDPQGRASLVVTASADGNTLTVRPTASLLGQQGVLELWAVPPQGAPRSLGIIDSTRRLQRALAGPEAISLRGAAAIAVSLEPQGGSPTGAPTGPVLFSGPLAAPAR